MHARQPDSAAINAILFQVINADSSFTNGKRLFVHAVVQLPRTRPCFLFLIADTLTYRLVLNPGQSSIYAHRITSHTMMKFWRMTLAPEEVDRLFKPLVALHGFAGASLKVKSQRDKSRSNLTRMQSESGER